jgi:anthranilate/para-aminobenzoate synthase component I
LFLHFDPNTGMLRTRPIKGTLAAGEDPATLLASEKDAAELAMIVDLMRNDLGRISEPGSVVVETGRVIENHPGVIHGVAEVVGRLRHEVELDEVLQATFPPGSITGAPKIRAMQVIDEFETVPRGPYCGALGFQSNCGHMALDVSIRTLDLIPTDGDDWSTHELRYGAGCGIVAESDPAAETVECDTKARLLREYIDTHCARPETLSIR